MLSHVVSDFKDTGINHRHSEDKVDPGAFSFMEPGWWALHATAIAGVYLLGNKLRTRYR
ncbi:MAG: hypothetical protein VB084_08885 [Syntrophomonadaceae bacterium]|nr:hypothetical protein [Syntrophomonadaceae bacterium]